MFLKPRKSEPYMPKILAAVQEKDYTKAQQIIQDSAIDYFDRLKTGAATIPVADAALLINLYHHIGNELAKADPVAAELATTIKDIKLPPIYFTRQGK